MDRGQGPSGGDIVAGIALILCGLCLLLVGGGCTALWVSELLPWRAGADMFGLAMLALSMGVAALGIAACAKGVRLMRRRPD